jgi:protein-S-isoprenylcysteine O-methyltransferase Ste14
MKNNIKLFALNILVYGIPIMLWSLIPFSKNMWGSFTSDTIFNYLFYGKVTYSAMGIIFDFFFLYCIYLLFRKEKPVENERVYLIASGIKKLFNFVFINRIKNDSEVSKEEKVSLLFYLVKLYFTPVMIGFLIGNMTSLLNFIPTLSTFLKTGTLGSSGNLLLSIIFPAMFYFILVLDTVIFAFGYLVESKSLKSIVKSVEPTALGWFVAVICYPPTNNLTANILGWYSSDFSDFKNININIATAFLSILLFAIYVWASVALGFKASNLTNRGIVSKGPYKYVRHPAYISKNLSWWIMGIPFIQASGFIAVFSLLAWTVIYFLRALTEERHLSQDPDYIEYAKKVKYMFIPGLF